MKKEKEKERKKKKRKERMKKKSYWDARNESKEKGVRKTGRSEEGRGKTIKQARKI